MISFIHRVYYVKDVIPPIPLVVYSPRDVVPPYPKRWYCTDLLQDCPRANTLFKNFNNLKFIKI